MMTLETVHAPDWRERSSYDYMDSLAKRDWSWEGVRRNADFISDWRASRSSFECVEHSEWVRVIRPRDASTPLDRWGLIYSDDPVLDSTEAFALWHPDYYRSTLSVTAVPPKHGECSKYFSLCDIHCRCAVFTDTDGRQHVVFRDRGRGLQILARGANLLNPSGLTIDAVADVRSARIQIELLRCFLDLWSKRRPKLCLNLKSIPSRRLKIVLRALDGALAGASQRDIAIALYGMQRVQSDWDDPREHLKDHVRRTIRRGLKMMRGGYLSFLK